MVEMVAKMGERWKETHTRRAVNVRKTMRLNWSRIPVDVVRAPSYLCLIFFFSNSGQYRPT